MLSGNHYTSTLKKRIGFCQTYLALYINISEWRVIMLKIAVCDDGWTDIETLEKALDQFDRYPVDYDVFFSAEELLKYRKEHEENYNMYIFDIEMPGMSGLELAKEIRKEDAKALFVFLTGYTSYVMDVFEVVTFDFIKKPVTAEKLSPVLLKAASYLDLTRQEYVFGYHFIKFKCCHFPWNYHYNVINIS